VLSREGPGVSSLLRRDMTLQEKMKQIKIWDGFHECKIVLVFALQTLK